MSGTYRPPHGALVIQAAREQGGEEGRMVASVMDEPSPFALVSSNLEKARFRTESLNQQEALAVLGQRTENEMTHFLDDQSDYLERADQSGVENSVVNFSLGSSKASQSLSIYDDAMNAIYRPSSDGGGIAASLSSLPTEQSARNYATAFGIDLERMRGDDDALRQAETVKLQQGIIDHVSSTFDNSPRIADSAERWDNAVETFEARNNSVVIAAGNEGEIEGVMTRENGGSQLRVPADFETNILENELVTSVGATEDNGNCRAAYASNSSGVDIYANGTVGESEGTSFAAPRVAVTMAKLHRLHPDKSSAQIEQMMTQNLTEQGCEANSGVPVLRPEVNLEFLRNQTY